MSTPILRFKDRAVRLGYLVGVRRWGCVPANQRLRHTLCRADMENYRNDCPIVSCSVVVTTRAIICRKSRLPGREQKGAMVFESVLSGGRGLLGAL